MEITTLDMRYSFSSAKVRARMAEIDMTESELVAALERAGEKTSANTVTNWFQGRTLPELPKFLALCAVLDVQPSELLDAEE